MSLELDTLQKLGAAASRIAELERQVAELRKAVEIVRRAFIDNDLTAEGDSIGNHPWIPGHAADAVIKVIDAALAQAKKEGSNG